MKQNSPKLFIKIDHSEISFIVGNLDLQNNFSLLEEFTLLIESIEKDKISDLQKTTNQIKKNILKIEENLNFTFKEAIIILNNFSISFLNVSGFKILNGSQILKENITYIINSLKSCVDENENKKKILHIFNTNYFLDKKKIDNIPIGLFGDFYSHELSFNLMNENDFNNLKSIFDTCNLKIKKIFTESFIKGALTSDNYHQVDTFVYTQINRKFCKIFFVENGSIKLEQSFNFGTNLIIKDILKITNLNEDIIKNIIEQNIFSNKKFKSEFIEQDFFENQNYRKIKKSLILKIAEARIYEFAEILFLKNINFKNFLNKSNIIYLEINDSIQLNCFKDIFRQSFSSKKKFQAEIIDKPKLINLVETANKITDFGWKSEAIPIFKEKASYFTRIFRTIFN